MSFDLTKIGFFQFDNLVRNRIPFILLHENLSFADYYRSMELESLNRGAMSIEFSLNPEEILKQVEEKKIPKATPIVFFTQSGRDTTAWVTAFEQAGFLNVFSYEGGWESFIREVKESI